MLFCSINGQLTTKISITDRAIAYGDGIFTTAKINNGKIELLDFHIARLIQSCQQLVIAQPDFNELKNNIIEIASAYQLAVLKIIISSGSGGRGYSRIGVDQPSVIISVHEFPQQYSQWATKGILLGDSEQKLGLNPMLAGMKHLNRLEQVLIRNELDNRKEDDLLICDINNHIVESSSSNIFWYKDQVLYTSMLDESGVEGVMRTFILSIVPTVEIVKVEKSALENAQAIFICNSIMGIIPVRQYNHVALSIDFVTTLQDKITRMILV